MADFLKRLAQATILLSFLIAFVTAATGQSKQQAPGLTYNAMIADGRVLRLYPVRASGARSTGVAFEFDGRLLRARDPEGPLWSRMVEAKSMFGGFDLDSDGWPDLALVRSRDSGRHCGDSPIHVTWLELVDGRTGQALAPSTPLEGRCFDFRTATDREPSKVYATDQWTNLGVLFGTDIRTVAVLPYYAKDGHFLTLGERGAPVRWEPFIYPSTAAFDRWYRGQALRNAWGQAQSFTADAHVANGLLVQPSAPRLVCFTTGRVLEYAVAPLGVGQLLTDRPFLPDGRKDLSGRNYGLVMADPASSKVVLIAGTDAQTVHADVLAGKMISDPVGGIERHVAVYDYRTTRIEDRYFSNANESQQAQYEKRVVFPCHCLLDTRAGEAGRLAYNVYEGGRWQLHISRPGATADAVLVRDWFVWDIRDLDGDGVREAIASPTRWETEPDVAGYYFPKWQTWVLRWDERRSALAQGKRYDGILPYLVPSFREGDCTSSRGSLYPVLTTVRGDTLQIIGIDAKRQVKLVDY